MADTSLTPLRDKVTRSDIREAYRQAQDELRETVNYRPEVLQSSRPVDVVHIRQQLLRWWERPGEWQRRFAMQGRRSIEGHEDAPFNATGTQLQIAEGFRDATLYWVSPEMCDLIAAMAPSIPETLPQPPDESGFVLLARSIPGTDAATGGTIYTTGYLWHTVMTVVGPCLAIETYSWRDIVFMYEIMNDELKEMFRQAVPCRLMPTGGSEWPMDQEISDFSKLTADDGIMHDSMVEDRRTLCTFWALASQKIALNETWQPDRATRRKAVREKWKTIPSVRIIRLREPTVRADHGAGRDVEWSHRWIVGKHWRNQWYPSTGQHRPKLIEPYQKGPADKPLKIRETVRALVR